MDSAFGYHCSRLSVCGIDGNNWLSYRPLAVSVGSVLNAD